jgi:hypothetical protein
MKALFPALADTSRTRLSRRDRSPRTKTPIFATRKKNISERYHDFNEQLA